VSAAPEPLAELLARWDVPPDAELTPAGRGTNNQTVTVAHRGRRWAPRISQNLSTAQVQAEHRLLTRLRTAGLPFQVPEPEPAADGGTVVETSSGPATLCRWIPGVHPDLAGERAMEGFGRAFGQLGQALRRVPAEDAPHDWRGDPLQVHPAVPDVSGLCLDLRAVGASSQHTALLETAARRLAAWWPGTCGDLPVQVVHGDPAASNTLVDEHTGRVTGLLDFEIAGTAFAVQGLVAGLAQSGALDGPRWPRRAAALIRGHASVRRLGRAEIEAVPGLLIGRSVGSVLWRAGRWRRGQATLGEVTERLDRLEQTTRWLEASGERLLSILADSPARIDRPAPPRSAVRAHPNFCMHL
jgi:homoserine kinase type II